MTAFRGLRPGLDRATGRPLVRFLGDLIAGHEPALACALACNLAAAACVAALPRWVAWLLREVLPAGGIGRLECALGLGMALVAIASACAFGWEYIFARLCHRAVARLRMRLFERLLHLPWRRVAEQAPGDLISRQAGDLAVLQQALVNGAAVFIPAAMQLAALLACMAWYSWQLALVVAAMGLPLGAAIHGFGRRIYASTRAAQAQAGNLGALLGEAVDGCKEIRSFGREDLLAKRFARINEEALASSLREQKVFSAHAPAVTMLTAALIGSLVLAAGIVAQHGIADGGRVIAFVACVGLVLAPVREVARSIGFLHRIAAVLGRMEEIPAAPEQDRAKPPLPPLAGRIELEKLLFSYGPGGFTLGPLDIEIAEGETVALVGHNGAGKTTLLNLLARFIEPSSGAVRVDGRDIAAHRADSLRAQVAIVTQEPFLFDGTLRENLLFGNPRASQRELRAAARAAHVEEFVERLALGYETPVGPRGTLLSAGQRQRLAIARALLKDAPILLLDEPTSSLDAESEELVGDALENARRNRTTIIVAHRLATLRLADRILTLHRGQLAETHTREVLQAQLDAGALADSLAL